MSKIEEAMTVGIHLGWHTLVFKLTFGFKCTKKECHAATNLKWREDGKLTVLHNAVKPS